MIEEIKTMAVTQKAALYQMLSEDEELNNYLISGPELFEELERRDKAFGKLGVRNFATEYRYW